jgi:hypothetical protein
MALYIRKVIRTQEVVEFWDCSTKDPKAYTWITKDGKKSPIEIAGKVQVEVAEEFREASAIESQLYNDLFAAQDQIRMLRESDR